MRKSDVGYRALTILRSPAARQRAWQRVRSINSGYQYRREWAYVEMLQCNSQTAMHYMMRLCLREAASRALTLNVFSNLPKRLPGISTRTLESEPVACFIYDIYCCYLQSSPWLVSSTLPLHQLSPLQHALGPVALASKNKIINDNFSCDPTIIRAPGLLGCWTWRIDWQSFMKR